MKNIIYILLVSVLFYSCGDEEPLDLETLFFSCNESGQQFDFEEYDGLVEECTTVLSSEDFNGSGDAWERDEGEYKRTVEGGKLLQESLNNVNWYFFNDISLSEDVNLYQIDVELDILSGSDDYFHVMTWGGRDRLDNYYSIGISGKNELRIGTVSNSQEFEAFFYLPISVAITNGANLLTVRVVDEKNYFFINEQFITSRDLNLYGSEIGFNAPAMSTNTLDNVSITQFRIE
jgi:hypothetical protein